MYKIIIAGFGGQGVLSAGQMFAYSAMTEGKEVSWLPSYGPEMRGGTANCSVIISDKAIAAPVVSSPDVLIAMNSPSLEKFADRVVPGGTIIVNSSLISQKVQRNDINVIYVEANKKAEELGTAKAANIYVLGVLNSALKIIQTASMLKGLAYGFAKKPNLIPLNEKIFNAASALCAESNK